MSIAASSTEPPPSTTAPSPEDGSFQETFCETLQTPYEAVYQLDSTGTYYIQPASLRGVPVARIDEHSEYWESSWDSLDEFLGHETHERLLKEHYLTLKKTYPHDAAIRKRAKNHQDNMSKHVKIREVFGDDFPYHPNQLVSKHHLPVEGLCQKEFMYRIACKVSDLMVLNSKGILKMDAWDFLRWRVHLQIMERLNRFGENARSRVRSAIGKIFDHQNMSHADPIMREAILLSAKYQNRLASFKPRGKNKNAHTPDTTVMGCLEATSADKFWQDDLMGPATETAVKKTRRQPSPLGDNARKKLKLDARKERRRRPTSQTGTYQGFNVFRVQRQSS